MLLWVLLAIVTAGSVLVLLRPLAEDDAAANDAASADVAVYKDQMLEIDNDLDRGLISLQEAEGARTELSRRLLSRAQSNENPASAEAAQSAAAVSAPHRGIAFSLAILVPILSVGLYLAVGSPGLPSQPHAERMMVSTQQASTDELIAKVEEQLRKTPEDGRGWAVLAPVYKRLMRFGDAANAYGQAIRLLGETPERLAGFAQSEIIANNGLVTEAAHRALNRWLLLQPENPEANFWLAQALEQDGKTGEAIAKYRQLLSKSPPDAPWRASVEQRVAELTAMTGGASGVTPGAAPGGAAGPQAGGAENAAPAPGPKAEDVAAAADMSPEQRQAFINQMVTRLAERLKENGNDAGGWKRLIRAYMVLGRKDDARSALSDARKAFAKSEEMQMEFDDLAKGLGLGS